jgi:serine/threonine protein kinase
MPAPTTIDGFLELGFKSGLLERETLKECQSNWSRAGVEPQSPKELADALIREGALTHFQAEKLIAGRWRGFLISGKYRLLERLGAGGMGAVYLCEHIMMGRKVALKILPVQQAEHTPKSLKLDKQTYFQTTSTYLHHPICSPRSPLFQSSSSASSVWVRLPLF